MKKTFINSKTVLVFLFLALLLSAGGFYIRYVPVKRAAECKVIEERIKQLRRMTTVTQVYRSVIYVKNKNFWRGTREVLFSIKYNVAAGVDFSRGFNLNLKDDGTVEVSMPGAKVFLSDADESTINQMLIRESYFLNQIKISDYMPQIIAQGITNRKTSVENGILERADTNARQAVLKILRIGGFDKVIFMNIPESMAETAEAAGTIEKENPQ